MPKLLMLKGLPASSKSTFAKELVDKGNGSWKRVNKDELRLLIDNGKHSRAKESFILQMRDLIVQQSLEQGFNIVVDDTNLADKHENQLQFIAKKCGAEFEVKFFDVPLHTCIERDSKRANPVGKEVIYKMYRQYLQPKPNWEETEKVQAFCFDLDGNLSDMGDRNPFDASTCENDSLILPVAVVLQKLSKSYTIILCSSREEKYREQTLKWLSKHNLPFVELYMRKSGDNRKDSIIKKEIYEESILPFYTVMGVFDDRLQVCQMLRDELGLMVFQTDWGYF